MCSSDILLEVNPRQSALMCSDWIVDVQDCKQLSKLDFMVAGQNTQNVNFRLGPVHYQCNVHITTWRVGRRQTLLCFNCEFRKFRGKEFDCLFKLFNFLQKVFITVFFLIEDPTSTHWVFCYNCLGHPINTFAIHL